MDEINPVFREFRGYWHLSAEMIAKASKEQQAKTARMLAIQAVHMTKRYGEQELPDLAHLLSASTLDEEGIGILCDGTEAFVGILATVSSGLLDKSQIHRSIRSQERKETANCSHPRLSQKADSVAR